MLPIIHISIECWKKNEEYGVYVSTEGRIKLIKNKKILEPRVAPDGYAVVFTEKGVVKVHRLVVYTWLGGKRNDRYTIDHIDSNRRNNSIKNLRWVEEDLNKIYALFQSAPADHLVETKQQTAEESDLALYKKIINPNISIKQRGHIGLELLKRNKIKIYYGQKKYINYNEFSQTFKNFMCANNSLTKEDFMGRILRVANQGKLYCNEFWYVQQA